MGGRPAVVEYEPDTDLRDTEQIPLQEEGGIEAFLRREVLPYAADAWYQPDSVKIGYEISFNRYFYKPQPMRTLEEIRADILALEKETAGLLDDVFVGGTLSMATQRYSVTPQSIDTLLAWVKSGEIAVPEIQRPFVWDATKVRNLLDSLYQGYPVGYLIAWQNPSVRLKDGSKSSGKRILIDGQQRVTALMAALLGREVLTKDYETVPIRIAFHPIEERFEVSNPAIRKDSAWIPDIAAVFDPNTSLTELTDDYAERNPEANRRQVSLILERVRKLTNNHVGVINLDEDLDIETVTEIFIRVNSAGASLSQADFAMSKIAVNETYGGNMLRKAIDYFCHLAVAPEFFSRIEKLRQGICCIRIPAEDAMAEGRERRPLRPHVHGHAAGRVHVGVSARQAAGPGRASVRS